MKIFIDPGHNNTGADTGAQDNGLKEQDITFYIAQKVGARLQKAGVEVKYSRPNPTDNVGTTVDDSLNKRAQMANGWGADYFVSIHCNAGGGTGVETYCLATGGKGELLAKAVQTSLAAQTALANRGVKTGNFAVLRKTNMPAILVECGFLDTATDAALLQGEAGQGKFAAGIALGVLAFLGISEAPQYVTVEQAIDILVAKGIITEPGKWQDGTWNKEDLQWLLRKMGTHLK